VFGGEEQQFQMTSYQW